MLLTYIRLLMCFVLLSTAQAAFGHGVPIEIDVVVGQLVVTGGATDSEGFAPQLFYDDSPDSKLIRVNSPVLGPIAFTDHPGFVIFGMEPQSGLYLEVLARPVLNASPLESRLLWHWSEVTQEIDVTANYDALRTISEFGEIMVPQSDSPVPTALQIAAPFAEDLGEHVHFLRYLFDDSPPATTGVYGFFARATSPSYDPSAPFLVVFNHGVDESLVETAARAINAAAIYPVVLPVPGDFDGDGEVMLSDYELWKLHFGENVEPFSLADGNGDGAIDAADYTVWRDAHLQSESGIGALAVPEPTTALLAVLNGLAVAVTYRRRTFSQREENLLNHRPGHASPRLN